MKTMYYDFAMNIKSKLCEDVNGRVIFEIYDPIDTVVFKIFFKDFDYSYAINNVQDRIYSGTASEVPEEIKRQYMTTIKKAFFKTENHKRRDEMAKMGVANMEKEFDES